jgi:pyruvate formate lyase activating enzyme
MNVAGSVMTLCFGSISSISNNPIEKKPFFHFAPSTMALTVGSWGCNATCPFCQNYEISKRNPTPDISRYVSPEEFVERALAEACEGTSISFNEAATLMLEWNIEVFRLAHKKGLYNTIVTNGYMTSDAIDLMVEAGLDAANVDIKGCAERVQRICGLQVEHVWESIRHMKEEGVHVELTTLVVPGLSDTEDCLQQIASQIVSDVGPDTPWHVNRYFPYYRYRQPETTLETLLKARSIGRQSGLSYVYIGNVLQEGLEDTMCPECGSLCYRRFSLHSTNTGTDADGRCTRCGHNLGIKSW